MSGLNDIPAELVSHGQPYGGAPGLVWLHVISDALIAAAYFVIAATLFYYVRRRRDLPFPRIYLFFGAFILAAGAAHLLAIWTLWRPAYAFEGILKLATAVLSVAAAALLVRLVPRALALPYPAELEAARENESLIKQLHHRVKNNLQVVSSLLSLQSTRVQDPEALAQFRESENRVRLIASIHEALYRSHNLTRLEAEPFVRDIAQRLVRSAASPSAVQLHIAVEPEWLDLETALPCGLIINELVSNSLRHAFPADAPGEIQVELREAGDEHVLRVGDDGVGLANGADWRDCAGLGWQLVEALTRQLGGRIETRTRAGTEFTITFPHRP